MSRHWDVQETGLINLTENNKSILDACVLEITHRSTIINQNRNNNFTDHTFPTPHQYPPHHYFLGKRVMGAGFVEVHTESGAKKELQEAVRR